MKKLVTIFIMIITLFIITGCSGGSYKLINGNLDATSHSISGSYKTFDGHYYKNIELKEGDVITFYFTISTQKGSISAKLYNKDNIITLIDNNTEVTIEKDGTYKVKVIADNHGGGFILNWNVN